MIKLSINESISILGKEKERFHPMHINKIAYEMAIKALEEQKEMATGVLRTIYDTPESCPNCFEHLSLEWSYCPECGRPTPWSK